MALGEGDGALDALIADGRKHGVEPDHHALEGPVKALEETRMADGETADGIHRIPPRPRKVRHRIAPNAPAQQCPSDTSRHKLDSMRRVGKTLTRKNLSHGVLDGAAARFIVARHNLIGSSEAK